VKNDAEKLYTCVLDCLFIIHIYIICCGRDRMVVFQHHFSQVDYTLINLSGHLRKYNNHIDLRFRIANFSLQKTVRGCTLQRLRKEDQKNHTLVYWTVFLLYIFILSVVVVIAW
jgi:hypothetical protein